jgi:carboxylate-amine ligase
VQDIRPHPDYGTIELRVMRRTARCAETIALVGVVHSLCAWLDARCVDGERPQAPSMWTLRENKWRASRWGFDAEVILADDGRTRPLREDLGELFGHLTPWASRCGAGPALATAAEMLAQQPSYERQRALFARYGSLVPVTGAR